MRGQTNVYKSGSKETSLVNKVRNDGQEEMFIPIIAKKRGK